MFARVKKIQGTSSSGKCFTALDNPRHRTCEGKSCTQWSNGNGPLVWIFGSRHYRFTSSDYFVEVKGEGADKPHMYVDKDNKAYGASATDTADCAICSCRGSRPPPGRLS